MSTGGWRRVAFAFLAACAVLGIAELALRLVGLGTPGERLDPFRGYSTHHPVFVEAESSDQGGQMSTSSFATGMPREDFAQPKPAEEVRVFLLGGSSVAGLYLRKHESMARQLDRALSVRHPDLEIETINAGREGKSSHTLATTVSELVRYEPDLLVIYSGHNDWPNSRWDAEFTQPTWSTRLRMLLDRSRLYVALRGLVSAGGMAGDDDSVLPSFDTPPGGPVQAGEMEEVERRFEEHLQAAIEAARSGGVSVVLCTVVSNPYSPPAGCRVDDEAGEVSMDEACQHFIQGSEIRGEEEDSLARAELELAAEQDSVPLRASGGMNEVVRRVADRNDLAVVDLAEVLDEGFGSFRGQPLFVDNVHPSAVGNKLIAEAIADRVLKEGLLLAATDQQ